MIFDFKVDGFFKILNFFALRSDVLRSLFTPNWGSFPSFAGRELLLSLRQSALRSDSLPREEPIVDWLPPFQQDHFLCKKIYLLKVGSPKRSFGAQKVKPFGIIMNNNNIIPYIMEGGGEAPPFHSIRIEWNRRTEVKRARTPTLQKQSPK